MTAGGQGGMNGKAVASSGDQGGTGGSIPGWAALAVAALLLAKALVDAASIADQAPAMPGWRPYVLELTSATFFAALLWPLWRVSRRLRPPHLGWPAALAAHLALSGPLLLAHLLWLAGSRTLLFAAAGESYRINWSGPQLLFEWRKDLLALVALAGVGWLLDRLFAPPPAPSQPETPPFRLAVKDGTRTILIAPHEISHVSSAGNYVELATSHGRLLHRITLAALATDLAPHGFARIHRAHLVRGAAVAAVANEGSGDFTVTLGDGTILPGSRRYRAALSIIGART